jgi:hypothetical protein
MVGNISLAREVESGVVEVLAGKRRCVNRRPAWIVAINTVLFYQVH